MAIYYLFDVGNAAIENFPQFLVRWKRSFNKADERTSDVGFDILLYDGLNHITFLCRLRFCAGGCCGGGLNATLNV